MAFGRGPKIVTDGLILAYDAANVRSFRGEPTTNLVTNANIMTGWITYYRTQALTTFITEFGTTGYRFLRQPSWNGIYQYFNLGSAGVYTFSAMFKYLGGSVNNNGATVYISNYGGGDTAGALDKSKIGVWQKVSHTVNVTSPGNVGLFLISYGGVDSGTGDPDFSSWEITQPQIELKSYSTAFVNGTRGTTVATGGGLIDQSLNNNNGELLNNVIYNSDNLGSLNFDGIDDHIRTSISGTFPQITFDYWGYYDDPSLNTRLRNESAFGDWTGNRIHWGTRWSVGMHWNVNNGWVEIPNTNLRFGWNHFSLVWNNSTSQKLVYINNILSSTETTNGNVVLGDFRIGVATNLNAYYRGNISNFKIYNKALSSTEVQINYNSSK